MKTPLKDGPIVELIGRYVLLREVVDALVEDAAESAKQRERHESQIRFLEEQLRTLRQPRVLLTEKETAAMLCVHIQSLKRWRQERPARIPFILMEGGDIRYRVDAIEAYLKSRERGNAKASLRAA